MDNSREYVVIAKVLSGPAAGELAYASIPVSRNVVEDAAFDLYEVLEEQAIDTIRVMLEQREKDDPRPGQ